MVRLVTTLCNSFALGLPACYCFCRRHVFPLGVLEIPFDTNRMVTATALHDLIAIEKLREQELEEARIIQSAMLPSHPLHEFDVLISHEFQPVTEVGGDYIDYFSHRWHDRLVSGRRLRQGASRGSLCGPGDRHSPRNSQNRPAPWPGSFSTQPAAAPSRNSGPAHFNPICDLLSGDWRDDDFQRRHAGALSFARSGVPRPRGKRHPTRTVPRCVL